MTTLSFATADFEQVCGWLEAHGGVAVEVWGLENERAAALLAYCEGPHDAFGWSNWARQAYEDPSELSVLFPQLQLIAEDAVTGPLTEALPSVFTTGAAS